MKAVLLLFALIPFGLRAQSLSPMVISPAGGTSTTSTVSMDYNIGEVAVTTLVSTNNILTQGFEQPSSGTSSIVSAQPHESGITAWPNPSSHILYVKNDDPSAGPSSIQLTDIQGRSLYEYSKANLSGQTFSIPMQNITPGMYLLKITKSESGDTQTIKIIKN